MKSKYYNQTNDMDYYIYLIYLQALMFNVPFSKIIYKIDHWIDIEWITATQGGSGWKVIRDAFTLLTPGKELI